MKARPLPGSPPTSVGWYTPHSLQWRHGHAHQFHPQDRHWPVGLGNSTGSEESWGCYRWRRWWGSGDDNNSGSSSDADGVSSATSHAEHTGRSSTRAGTAPPPPAGHVCGACTPPRPQPPTTHARLQVGVVCVIDVTVAIRSVQTAICKQQAPWAAQIGAGWGRPAWVQRHYRQ